MRLTYEFQEEQNGVIPLCLLHIHAVVLHYHAFENTQFDSRFDRSTTLRVQVDVGTPSPDSTK